MRIDYPDYSTTFGASVWSNYMLKLYAQIILQTIMIYTFVSYDVYLNLTVKSSAWSIDRL